MSQAIQTSTLSSPLLEIMGESERPVDPIAGTALDEAVHNDDIRVPAAQIHHRKNDASSSSVQHHHHCWQSSSQITAMVSNFSTSYNVVNISLVLPILDDLYTTTPEDKAAVSSSLLAGMMVGQLMGGALGDSRLGRLGALRLVMALQIIASLASALQFGDNVLVTLSLWRFVLGVGAGGVYPLAAVLSAEEGTDTVADNEEETEGEKRRKLQRIVLTFSMQGLGFLSVSLVTVPLLQLVSNLDLVWRLVLGLGSLPGIILALLQARIYQRSTIRHDAVPQNDPSEHPVEVDAIDEESVQHDDNDDLLERDDALVTNAEGDTHSPSLWQSVRQEPDLWQKLIGTAGTWFLFDMLFYGNTLFEPVVMEAAFGGKTADDEIKRAATDSLLLAMIALPGYIVSAVVLGRRVCYVQQSPRFVQSQGFAMMAMLYAVIGAYWSSLRRVPALLVLTYGATFFFANYGPNTTTFVFPSLVYSHDCRSTLNGVSAAAGKLGALVGAVLFEPAADRFGDAHVMLICAGVSVLAFATTRCFVNIPAGLHHRNSVAP